MIITDQEFDELILEDTDFNVFATELGSDTSGEIALQRKVCDLVFTDRQQSEQKWSYAWLDLAEMASQFLKEDAV